MRVFFGILLIGAGGYVAWEAHSILNWGLFQFATMAQPNIKISPTELQMLNSFLSDFLYDFGAETLGMMQRYLTIARVVGAVVALFGGYITFFKN